MYIFFRKKIKSKNYYLNQKIKLKNLRSTKTTIDHSENTVFGGVLFIIYRIFINKDTKNMPHV